MAKQKFERKKPHVNVGTIGHVDVITSYSIHYTKLYESPRNRGGIRDPLLALPDADHQGDAA